MPKTLSDTATLDNLIGKNRKKTDIVVGVNNFINWYLEFYGKGK